MTVCRAGVPLVLLVSLATVALGAPQPTTVVAPAVPRADVIDPSKVAVAVAPTIAPEPKLVPNEFPDAASLPLDRTPAPPPPPSAPIGSLIYVNDPDGRGKDGGAPLSTLAYPAIDVRLDGSFDNGVAPPDPVMAVGRGHVVSLVNSLIQFNQKDGTLVGGPYTLRAFFGVPDGFGISDPLALYDPFVDRFIVAVMADNGTTRDARLCVAFSTTGDPLQPWNKYFIDADLDQPDNWLDYPASGLDRLAVYLTGNMWVRSGGFSNVTVFVYDKEAGYRGEPLRGVHLIDVRTTGNGAPFRLRPGVVDEIAANDDYWFAQMDGASDKINLFRLRGPRFESPEFTAFAVPTPSLYLGPDKARQPGTVKGVASGGGGSWNTWYRRGTLWLTNAIRSATGISSWVHKVDVSGNPPVRLRTWQIDGGTRDVYFPHVVPDVEDDDFALITAYSGNDLYVTGRYWNIDGVTGAVRVAEDMATGSQANISGRHGDYFAVGTDPLDRNRIWGVAQYMAASTFSGNVRIASARFEDVPPPVAPVPVPDGSVRAGRGGGGEVTITWDASSCVAPDHHVVWFDLASLSTYPTVAETCAIGSSGSWTGAAPDGNVAFVVVADDGAGAEGSHGTDSRGWERPSQARSCGIGQKVWSAVCVP